MDAAVKSDRLRLAPNRCDPHADCRHAPGRLRERLCALRLSRRQSAFAQARCAIDPVAMRSNLIQPKPPPRDCPKIITLPGSPPKFAMLSCTHSSAATKSRLPTLAALAYFAPPISARFK